MALPNNTDEIKVYPSEYINNVTVNRPNLRLLQNDEYLEGLITSTSGVTTGDLSTLSAAIDSNTANIAANTANINTISGTVLSAMILVDPPASVSATGADGQVALSGEYMYVYNNLSGSVNWGRIDLDFVW